jgi:hypothetical protein
MDKINTRSCKEWQWYYDSELNQRLFCVAVDAENERATFVSADPSHPIGFKITRLWNYLLTPLPDCTGWDWVAPPKYRPFKDAAELLEYGEFRRITYTTLANCSCEYGIGMVDLRMGQDLTICKLWDVNYGWTPWLSAQTMLEHCTFADTGEPCGVKL